MPGRLLSPARVMGHHPWRLVRGTPGETARSCCWLGPMRTDLGARVRRLELRRRFMEPLPPPREDGWAHGTVGGAMRRPVLLAVVILQVLMAVVALVDHQERSPELALAALHVGAVVLAVAALRGHVPPVLAVVAADVGYLADWASTDSLATPLVFAACWARNLSVAVPTFAMPARPGLAMQLVSSLAIPVAMVALRPDLLTSFAGAVAVTGLSITVVTRIGVSFLGDLVATVDRENDAADARRRELAHQQAASRTAAEDARILHDTVINTMVAIAAGGAALRDVDLVRERCRQDVAALELLRSGAEERTPSSDLRELPAVAGIRVVHLGMPGPELADLVEALPPRRVQALRRSCAELVQNAARHSGADEVRVRIEREGDALVVDVDDDGRGFDLDSARGADRGLARSVLARCEEAGIEVRVRTAPGAGTWVRMTTRLELAAPALDDHEWEAATASTLAAVVRRAGLLYTSGLTLVGFVLAFSNHQGEPNTEYVMAALNALVVLTVVASDRAGWAHRDALQVVLLVTVPPISYVMTAVAVDLGRDLPVLWQAIGPTGPLVLLLGHPRGSPWVRWAVGLYLVTTGAVALRVAPDSVEAAGTCLVAGVVGLGLVAAWSSFMTTLVVLGREAASARRRAELDRVELVRRIAGERARERWRQAGLDDALDLVQAIARGDRDARDPEVRSACAAEESYLRQLTLLDPQLVRLGGWLVQSLARARARRVDLSVRAGGGDVPEHVARRWGGALRELVESVDPGGTVVASVFPDQRGTRLMVLAPTEAVDLLGGLSAPEAHRLAVADQTLLEVVVTDTDLEPPRTRAAALGAR